MAAAVPGLFALALLLPATAQAQFAFPNSEGTRLLATADIGNPEALRTALCSAGRRVTVEFDGRQLEGRNSSGRQAAHNFTNTAGSVFRITSEPIDPQVTCFLVTASFLSGTIDVSLKQAAADARCSRDWYPAFEAEKLRPIVGCWLVAQSTPGVAIALLEFARRLQLALASLVVIDRDRRIYVDYAAEFTGPGADLWRVDDGGELHPEGFDIVFLLKRGTSYLLAVSWTAAEGVSLGLWEADSGAQFTEIVTDGWYRSPL